MGSIRFHSPSQETVSVGGGERHLLAGYCINLTNSFLPNYLGPDDAFYLAIPDGHYLKRTTSDSKQLAEFLKTAVAAGGECSPLNFKGEPVNCFLMQLNTALKFGGRSFEFAARIHGQSEVHAYIEGENRAWFSEWIVELLGMPFIRKDRGWEEVVELLLSRDDEPVVMSYSVCQSFPNADNSLELYEDDEWDNVSHQKQWETSMKYLRHHHKQSNLEITPNDSSLFFGDGLTILDVVNQSFEKSEIETSN